MDIFEKAQSYMDAKLAKAAGYYPYFLPLEDTEGTEVTIGGKRLLMIGSNNYLGLTTDPRVRQAAIDAIARYGTSCTGSRFLNGTLALHQELEARLAAYVGKPAALVFSTGYQTNLGTISSIVARGDVVLADKDDHASIVDGCKLSFGEMRRFSHNDMAHLDRQLAGIDPKAGRLVVVDGVYSMGGDIAPLPEIVPICRKHGARLMVDDAHSLGVMARGRGTAAHFGLTDQVDLIMGTFSKSFASLGGFIAGDDRPHPLHPAPCPRADLQRLHARLQRRRRPGGTGHHGARTRACRPVVGGHRAHAGRADRPGVPHGPQRHADHPDRHRHLRPHHGGLEALLRGGAVRQRRCLPGSPAGSMPAPNELHGHSHR